MSRVANSRWIAALRPAASGFTLVELLVSVSVLALLVSLLVPGLARARQAAQQTICASNQRQMAIAAHAYATGQRDVFPQAYSYRYQGLATISVSWDLTTTVLNDQVQRVQPGLLWQGGGVESIQQCPSFTGHASWLHDPYTGYNYNTSFIGGGEYESIPRPARVGEVRSPSNTALFGDGGWAQGANKFMRAPFPNPRDASFSGRYGGTQGFRHLRATNVAFVDGHAKSLADRHVENADGVNNVAVDTGFLSADNSLYDLE